jgi:purine-binding chemotaxis protein CheW
VAAGSSSRYILGMGKVGDEVKILLDVNKLLFEEELAML